VTFFIISGVGMFLGYFFRPLGYMKLYDFVVSANIKYIEIVLPLSKYATGGVQCIFLLIGALFSGLTILHLKNSDTAVSDASTRNIRKGIIAIVTMNMFNVFVILSAVGMTIVLHQMGKKPSKIICSTISDFVQFTNVYGIPMSQSAFNSLSFLAISSSFKVYFKKITFPRKVSPRGKQQKSVITGTEAMAL
jgi:hypothetical protein